MTFHLILTSVVHSFLEYSIGTTINVYNLDIVSMINKINFYLVSHNKTACFSIIKFTNGNISVYMLNIIYSLTIRTFLKHRSKISKLKILMLYLITPQPLVNKSSMSICCVFPLALIDSAYGIITRLTSGSNPNSNS